MADVPHILIIGDEIGSALYDAFFTIPGTGAIWKKTFVGEGNTIEGWAAGDYAAAALQDIAKGANGATPDRAPDQVLVSLGRTEILNEPKNITSDALAAIAGNTKRLVDQLRGLGLKVAWVLPPLATGEGKTRNTIEAALASSGVRFFPAEHSFTDPSVRGGAIVHFEAPKADGSASDTIQRMADLLATWLPLGPPRGPIVPRPGATPQGGTFAGGGAVTGFFSSGRIGALSTPTKIAIGAGTLALIGGAIWYGRKAYG